VLHLVQVESQIDAVAKTVDEAAKRLPSLTQEQQTVQVCCLGAKGRPLARACVACAARSPSALCVCCPILQLLLQLAEMARAEELLNRLSRVAAAINLRTSDPLTESGHDPVADLRHYYATVANSITPSWEVSVVWCCSCSRAS
jgi:hypothetical protein